MMDYIILFMRWKELSWYFCNKKNADTLSQKLNSWLKYVDFWNGMYISSYDIKTICPVSSLNDIEREYYSLTENEKAYLKNQEVDDDPIKKIVKERGLKKGVDYILRIKKKYNESLLSSKKEE